MKLKGRFALDHVVVSNAFREQHVRACGKFPKRPDVDSTAESDPERTLNDCHVFVHRMPVRRNAVAVGEPGAENVRLAGLGRVT
jgi:hypothetical protein